MNRRLADPFQAADLPEHIEEFLARGSARCCSFNRNGNLLAAGCEDGSIVIWDFETRGVASVMRGHEHAVTCIGWTRDGRTVVSGSADQTIGEWDVLSGRRTSSHSINNTIMGISVSRRNSRQVLVSCVMGPPLLLDLSSAVKQELPLLYFDGNILKWKPEDQKDAKSCHAVFSRGGDLIFVAAPKGSVLVVATETLGIMDVVKIGSTSSILGLELSHKGALLLVNSNDRAIHMLAVEQSPLPDLSDRLPRIREDAFIRKPPERGSVLGSDCILTYRQGFQDAEDKQILWKTMTFTHDSEYVIAAVKSKTQHHVYIWSIGGQLVRVLEGPQEGIADVRWHPCSSMLLTVSSSNGRVYIWAKIYNENWSAFAPDFKELDQNTEYVEREDEFDVKEDKPEDAVEEDGEEENVDVLTIERTKVFSSDDEDGGQVLTHLPIDAKHVMDSAGQANGAEAVEGGDAQDAVSRKIKFNDAGSDGAPSKVQKTAEA